MTKQCTININYRTNVNDNYIYGNMNIILGSKKLKVISLADETFQKYIIDEVVKPLFNNPKYLEIDWAKATMEIQFFKGK